MITLIRDLWEMLVSPNPSIRDIGSQKVARLTSSITIVLAFFLALGLFFSYLRTSDLQSALVGFGGTLALSILAYIISRTTYYRVGGFFLVLGFYINALTNILFRESEVTLSIMFYMPLGLVIGSALLSQWALFLSLGLSIATVVLLVPLGIPLPDDIAGPLGIITTIGLLLILFMNYRDSIEKARLRETETINQQLRDLQLNLEERVNDRTLELNKRSSQLEAAAIVARQSAEIKELQNLLDETANLIAQRFNYYHVGVFLLDDSGANAILRATSSEGGKRMIARGHQLRVGQQGIVGNAAATRRPRIASDVGSDATYFDNPELPDTHAEMALPLVSKGKVIGVLDIQSAENRAFSQEDINVLQILADQVALSIENAQLLTESQLALTQLRELVAEQALGAWKRRSYQMRGYRYTPMSIAPSTGDIPDVKAGEGDLQDIKIPVTLRGMPIGVITMKRKGTAAIWTDREKDLITEIGAQIGLALENARLLEETKSRAEQERRIGEIARQFSRMNTLEGLLESAVAELGKALNADEASIEIKIAD